MFAYDSLDYPYTSLMESEYLNEVGQALAAEMGSGFRGYRFVVWSMREGQTAPRSLPDIFSAESKSTVLIIVSDEGGSVPTQLVGHYRAIFKCYLPRDHPTENIYSFPIGYAAGVPSFNLLPTHDRPINLFFSGCAQTSRSELWRALVGMATLRGLIGSETRFSDIDFGAAIFQNISDAFPASFLQLTPGFGLGLDRVSYSRMLHDSKVALCPAGWRNSETFRHFEAMRAGCILISAPLPQTRLYADAPLIILDDWSELETTIKELFNSPDRMSQLQNATMNWWKNVCSPAAVAHFICRVISKQ